MAKLGEIHRKMLSAAIELEMREKYKRQLVGHFISVFIVLPCLWFFLPGMKWISISYLLWHLGYFLYITLKLRKLYG
jgi:hypothetical protein